VDWMIQKRLKTRERLMDMPTVLRLETRHKTSRLTHRVGVGGVLVFILGLSLVSLPVAGSAGATTSVPQSSISIYLSCPGSIALAYPASTGSCSSGNFTGVYGGVNAIPLANLTSFFYLASATGGVKVTFGLADSTTGKPILSGVGYGSMSGGTCSSPTLVIATKFTPTSNTINSGDKLVATLNTTFTGTGTPTFCSGGLDATLIQFKTSVLAGSNPPLLSSILTPGQPVQTAIGGYEGVAQNYTNTASISITAIVQGVVKNQAGSTVDVLSTSITLAPGEEVAAFLPFKQYPSGSYTVATVAITSSFVPISASAVAEASV